MTTLAIVIHLHRDEVPPIAMQALAWCTSHGVTPLMPREDAGRIGKPELGADTSELQLADACLSLGGDGTILRAVQIFGSCEVPILGLNAGRLGYLTEFDPEQLGEALESWNQGDLKVERRMMLSYQLSGSKHIDNPEREGLALNEVVVDRAESGHTVSVDVKINGRSFTTMLADGLIVSTPTGSTAYSLSAGGPIVEPTTQAILLTPIAAHMVFNRTMVLGATSTVELVIEGYRQATVTVDGRQVGDLAPGESLLCEVSAVKALLLVTGERDFHSILKEKFGLTDR